MWFASTRTPTCTTKISGGAQRLCTKVWQGAKRQCAKVSWARPTKRSVQRINGSLKGCVHSLNPPHAIFERSTKSLCAQRLCLHKVFVHTKPSRTPRNLHTDNPNGSGIVVFNNRKTINIIECDKRSVTYTWIHRPTNGHGIL